MSPAETAGYIAALKSRGSRPGLLAVSALAAKMGDPQKKLRAVHIAGTNAKGSVLAYLSNTLKAAGIKSGCFYSPALKDERDSICVNLRPISRKDWDAYWDEVRSAEAELESEGVLLPTFFEALTVLAFKYFADKGCEIAVIECGMGGAGDATNILTDTKVCVLTPVSYDHCQFLGSSLSDIAAQKCGIIKPGAVVVSARQAGEVMAVIERAAEEKKCKLMLADEPEKIRYGLTSQSFTLKGHTRLKISLAGACQPENAALAVKALEALAGCGYKISEKAVAAGLPATQWYGRFSVLAKNPYVIADGAHNEAGALALRRSLDTYFPDTNLVLLMGVLRDKEYDKMLKILGERAAFLVCITPPSNPRALDALELAECGAEYVKNTTAAGSVEEGLEMALLLSGGKMPVIACGSLSWLQRLREAAGNPKV